MSFDFMVEMAWKSALISAAALLIASALRFRPAGERSGVLRAAVGLILALPLITLLLPALPVVTGTIEAAPPVIAVTPMPLLLSAGAVAAPPPGLWDDPTPLLELMWIGGVLMVALRLGAGLWTLGRWTRGASPVACTAWTGALAKARAAAGCTRDVRLLASDAPAPMSWGWLRPVILIDRDTLRDPSEADGVLAHEIAHIVRRDWLVLILARLAVALFWFNPLLWLLDRRLVDEAEEAADARALAFVDPARYARTLLACAQQAGGRALPATAIADRGLGRRVKAILGRRIRAGAPDKSNVRAAMAACVLVAAPIAALKPVVAIVPARQAPPAPAAPLAARAAAAAPEAPDTPRVPDASEAAAASDAPALPDAPDVPEAAPAPAAPTAPMAPQVADAPRAPLAPVAPVALAMIAPPAPPAAPARPGHRDFYWSDEDNGRLSRDIEQAVGQAMRARDEAMRSVHVNAEQVREAVRRGMAAGAQGMEAGARGMERGADRMEMEADKLRSKSYRDDEIARHAREGRTMTDSELLAMIPRLQEGARSMRRGAESMRRNAARMAAGRTD